MARRAYRSDLLMAMAMVVSGLACSSCQLPRWLKPRQAMSAVKPVPQRQGAGTGAISTGQAFELDDKSGRPKPNIVLRLDYFPPAGADGRSLPSCYAPLSPETPVGVAACAERPTEVSTVLAKNVAQECYTDPKAPRAALQQPLQIGSHCRRGLIMVDRFEPELRLDIELR